MKLSTSRLAHVPALQSVLSERREHERRYSLSWQCLAAALSQVRNSTDSTLSFFCKPTSVSPTIQCQKESNPRNMAHPAVRFWSLCMTCRMELAVLTSLGSFPGRESCVGLMDLRFPLWA